MGDDVQSLTAAKHQTEADQLFVVAIADPTYQTSSFGKVEQLTPNGSIR